MKFSTIRFLGIPALLAVAAFSFSSISGPNAQAVSGDKNKGARLQAENVAPTASFTNSTPITINDGDEATPYPSDIVVTGLTGNVTNVKVTINGFSHQFSDDVGILLKGPNGNSILLQNGAGDEAPMTNVTYTIGDEGATRLPDLTAWGPGTYKPTNYYFPLDPYPAPGPGTAYANPGPSGSGTGTLATSFNGASANGTWSLFIIDFVIPDTGSISGGWTLEVTTDGPPTAVQNHVDFNGDGKTDFATVRNTGGGSNGQITWYVGENSVAGTVSYKEWGLSNDFFVPEDYDGDNKTDHAVWRPGPGGVAAWYIFQSQTNTVRAELFGQTGDEPRVVGDYDGDGKADLAVYRGGAALGDQSSWFYRTTPGGPVFGRVWGQNGDFPAPGDYDGDGKRDFAVQRNHAGGQAAFWFNYAAAAPGVMSRFVVFGTPSDNIVPGDYNGDGKTDLAVARSVGGVINWFIEPSTALGTFDTVLFGAASTDFLTQGDYDGDGKTDPAVFRPSATPGASFFAYRQSSNGVAGYKNFSQAGDYPVANYNRF